MPEPVEVDPLQHIEHTSAAIALYTSPLGALFDLQGAKESFDITVDYIDPPFEPVTPYDAADKYFERLIGLVRKKTDEAPTSARRVSLEEAKHIYGALHAAAIVVRHVGNGIDPERISQTRAKRTIEVLDYVADVIRDESK